MGILVALVFAIGIFAYWLVTRRKQDSRSGSARHAVPASALGKVSVVVLLVGLIAVQLAKNIGIGALFGLVAFVAALGAITRRHDRGYLLVLPLVVGVVMVAIPLAFWIAG